jgi:hypothetical protein
VTPTQLDAKVARLIKALPDKVNEELKARDLSSTAAARELGLSYFGVYEWTQGGLPSTESLIRIALALDLSLDELVLGE